MTTRKLEESPENLEIWEEVRLSWCSFKRFGWRSSQLNRHSLTIFVKWQAVDGKHWFWSREASLSVWWRMCVFTPSASCWAPVCSSALSSCCCHSIFLPPLSRLGIFFCVPFLPTPPPPSMAVCSPSEWSRLWSTALDSSRWQPPQPDDRKQTLEQRLDVNGPWFLLVMALCLFVWGLTELSLHTRAEKALLGFLYVNNYLEKCCQQECTDI